MLSSALLATATAAARPAGGAAIGQVILATSFATAATAGLLWLMQTYRAGRNRVLAGWADFSERVSGLPGWAALPAGVAGASLMIALLGFPLDDMWHRLFGQDVTLWGPTHLMLFGGAGMTLIGQAVLLHEGMRARRSAGLPNDTLPIITSLRRVGLMGGLLIGLSTF